MTGEEKRQQLKEQYKAELKKRKEFLEQAKRMQTSRKLNDAIANITNALNDDSDDWIEQLNRDSAISEAKMDMFLDEAAKNTNEVDQLAKQAELEKLSAENLVQQMKREMGLLSDEPEKPTTEEKETEESQETDTPPKPKKSLGDI